MQSEHILNAPPPPPSIDKANALPRRFATANDRANAKLAQKRKFVELVEFQEYEERQPEVEERQLAAKERQLALEKGRAAIKERSRELTL
jgi:hypothetical protein